ncbi:hypothetical protein JCM33374_g3834 [Metschnikowia sp. JCM 33374]|nr:hypothetical protein JCM33374_g3834 [Metschnikowia sp. JCM 33374]
MSPLLYIYLVCLFPPAFGVHPSGAGPNPSPTNTVVSFSSQGRHEQVNSSVPTPNPEDSSAPSSDEDYADAFGHLVIDRLPAPPTNLFPIPDESRPDYDNNRNFRGFLWSLRGFIRKSGFDEVSFHSNIDVLDWQYSLFEGYFAKLSESGYSAPETAIRLFNAASYYYRLMVIYHILLKKGIYGAYKKPHTDCVVLLMKYIDLEISLLSFLDVNGYLCLKYSHDERQRNLMTTRKNFKQLSHELKKKLSEGIPEGFPVETLLLQNQRVGVYWTL